jgi:hypothetical protein
MKVRNNIRYFRKGLPKKVRLIDGLGITGGYKFYADSFKVSPLSLSFRKHHHSKINITGSASIDPYDDDTLGREWTN